MKSNKKKKWANARHQREATKYHKKGWIAYYLWMKKQKKRRQYRLLIRLIKGAIKEHILLE